MAAIKTGTMYGYRANVIGIDEDGTPHALGVIFFPWARNEKDVDRMANESAKNDGFVQLVVVKPTLVRFCRKWAVDVADIVKSPSFHYTTDPEDVPDTDDEGMVD